MREGPETQTPYRITRPTSNIDLVAGKRARKSKLADDIESLNQRRRFWHFGHQIEIAAMLQDEHEPSAHLESPDLHRKVVEEGRFAALDYSRRDTLRRTKVKPFGKTLQHLKQNPADDLADLYDPDAVARSFYRPAELYSHLDFVPVKAGGEWIDPPGYHRLQIPFMENRKGQWRLGCRERRIRTGKELQEFSETNEYRRARFLEATGDWVPSVNRDDYRRYVEQGRTNGDIAEGRRRLMEAEHRLQEGSTNPFDFETGTSAGQSVTGQIDQEFVPIAGGISNRQLYLYAHWEQTAKCFEMKNHSELAKAAIGITSDFSLGRGVSWKIENETVSRIWQEFWDRNKMEMRLRTLSDDLVWQGELLIRKYEVIKGKLAIRSLDPGNFYEIVTNPADVETVYWYWQQNPTAWQQLSSFRGRNLNVPSLKYIITQYPPSEIHHIKSNVSAGEKWGRSDFFAALGTLKRHRDWTNAVTLKDMLQANLVYLITVKGDQGDVEAYVSDTANMQLPGPGGTFIQNEALSLELLHENTTVGGRGEGSTGQFLTALFATAVNMPLTYFNVAAGGTARATALTQGEPFVKKISTRQQEVRDLLDHLFEAVMKCAMEAGLVDVKTLRHEDADPEWIFPSVYEEDRGAKFRDLKAARESGSISHRTVATQQAQELGLAEYSYEEEMDQIDEERREGFLGTWPEGTEVAAQLGPQQPPQGPPADGQEPGDLPPLDQTKGRNEEIAGADERGDFRKEWRDHPTESDSVSRADRVYLEAALPGMKVGEGILLPSGRVARKKHEASTAGNS